MFYFRQFIIYLFLKLIFLITNNNVVPVKCNNENVSLSCDFNSKTFCNWNNIGEADDKPGWVFENESYLGNLMQKKNERYDFYIVSTPVLKSNSRKIQYIPGIHYSKIISPNLKANPTGGCLSFDYYQDYEIGKISVIIKYTNEYKNEPEKIVFLQSGIKSTEWKSRKIDINSLYPFQIIIEAMKYIVNNEFGLIAIDNIVYDQNRKCDDNSILFSSIKKRKFKRADEDDEILPEPALTTLPNDDVVEIPITEPPAPLPESATIEIVETTIPAPIETTTVPVSTTVPPTTVPPDIAPFTTVPVTIPVETTPPITTTVPIETTPLITTTASIETTPVITTVPLITTTNVVTTTVEIEPTTTQIIIIDEVTMTPTPEIVITTTTTSIPTETITIPITTEPMPVDITTTTPIIPTTEVITITTTNEVPETSSVLRKEETTTIKGSSFGDSITTNQLSIPSILNALFSGSNLIIIMIAISIIIILPLLLCLAIAIVCKCRRKKKNYSEFDEIIKPDYYNGTIIKRIQPLKSDLRASTRSTKSKTRLVNGRNSIASNNSTAKTNNSKRKISGTSSNSKINSRKLSSNKFNVNPIFVEEKDEDTYL